MPLLKKPVSYGVHRGITIIAVGKITEPQNEWNTRVGAKDAENSVPLLTSGSQSSSVGVWTINDAC